MYVEFYRHSEYPFSWCTSAPTFLDQHYLFEISTQSFLKLLGKLEQLDLVVVVMIVGTNDIVEHSILISCVKELCYLNENIYLIHHI